MSIFSKLRPVKRPRKNRPQTRDKVSAAGQNTKVSSGAQDDERGYPGAELEDYFLYYLKDPLKDTLAARARVLYINKKELLFEVDNVAVVSETLKAIQDIAERKPETTIMDPAFESGKSISLKLQIPFRSDFVRATGRITGVEYDMAKYTIKVKVVYTKILGSDNEVLFDTILDMLL